MTALHRTDNGDLKLRASRGDWIFRAIVVAIVGIGGTVVVSGVKAWGDNLTQVHGQIQDTVAKNARRLDTIRIRQDSVLRWIRALMGNECLLMTSRELALTVLPCLPRRGRDEFDGR